MKVLVFAKQIPDINKITFNPETGRINRENVPLTINSFDKRAVEEAIRLKEKHGCETAVATMGPPQAGEIINESLRMGIDAGYLITDRSFAGADTLVTSKILAKFVEKIRPDIVLMGKYSLDGETSQVPPEVAVLSGYGFKSSISKIDLDSSSGKIEVEHEFEEGISRYRVGMPVVFSVSEKINRARKAPDDAPQMLDRIEKVDSQWLGIEVSGIEDSPTVVQGTATIESVRNPQFLEFNDEVYPKVLEIINRSGPEKKEPEEITLPDYKPSSPFALGIALDDAVVAIEIAAKLSELANENGLNVVMAGNINPSELSGMSCHRYIHIKAEDPDLLAPELLKLIQENGPKHVVYPSTNAGRELSATVAATLGLGLTADCIDLALKNGKLVQYKPAFGGGIVATIVSKTSPDMATVRPGMFKLRKSQKKFDVETVAVTSQSKYEKIGFEPVSSEFKPLGASNTVVGVGRGLKSKSNLEPVLKLAEKLNASVGGSRPVVDMRWMPRQQQIGITGLSISPKTYLTLALSGQDNHVVGIRYAGKVIAVNTDREAPIFRHADYGIIGDALEFVTGFLDYLSRQ